VNADRASRFATTLLDRAVIVVAAFYVLLYAAVALLRMGYPFEIEWMEGGVLTEVQRVLQGRPLYVAPTLGYIPFDYTPLYLWVAALPARVMGPGFTALRLTSFAASLGCFALIFVLVRRQTASVTAALIAVGLFAATYRLGGAWLDIARADSLFLLLVLAAILALDRGRAGVRGWALAGTLLGLAFLAKQTALVVAAPLLLYALLSDRRRFLALAGALAVVVGGSTLLLNARSAGWYGYYVFGVAGGHAIDPRLTFRFWTRDLLTPFAPATLLALAYLVLPAPEGRPAGRGFHAAAIAGLAGSAWWLRMFPVCYDNDLIPAFAGVAMLAGFGWQRLRGPGSSATGVARLVAIAVLIQFATLAWSPRDQLPTRADREAGMMLVENLRRAPGRLLVPSHPYLTARAGKPEHFHEVALTDVLKRRDQGPLERALTDSLAASFRGHRWDVIVLDSRDWMRSGAEPYYEARWAVFDNDTVLWSRTGMLTRPQALLAPRADSGSAR
jgi:hypothetical protein